MSSWRNPTKTKRACNITLTRKDFELIKKHIPQRGLSAYIRRKLREDFAHEFLEGSK